MADGFCAQCGAQLRSGARFCAGCGAKVEAPPDGLGLIRGVGISIPKLEPLLPSLMRDSDSREEQVTPWGLTTKDLDHFVSCSLTNAVMDTCLLLVQDSSGNALWVPVNKLQSMQDLSAVAAAMVIYHVGETPEPFCLPQFLRDETSTEVLEAFMAAAVEKPCVEVSIALQFRPVDYGDLEAEIRGRWATVVNDQGLKDIRAILQMPFSGRVLKQRLSEHEAFLKQLLDAVTGADPGSEEAQMITELFNERISNLRAVVKQMPDGDADHIYCIASVSDGGKDQPTVQAELTAEERRRPVRSDMRKRITKAFRTKSPLLFKRRPARISTAKPIRSSLMQDIGKGWGRDAAPRVKGNLRSTI